MASAIERPEIQREILGADQFGIVVKPLSAWEHIYNQGWLRKTMQPGSTGEKTAPQSTEKAQEQNVDQWEKLLADAVPK